MTYPAFVWYDGALYQMFKAPDIYRKWQGTSHSTEQFIWDGEEMILIEPEFEEPLEDLDLEEIDLEEIDLEETPELVVDDFANLIKSLDSRIRELEERVEDLEYELD